MSFIAYLREEEKKAKTKKEEKKEKKEKETKGKELDAQKATPGNSPDVVPGAVMGTVMPQQPPTDNIAVSPATQGNIEAYNVMKAFAMGMENNLPSVTLLKQHPTPEISQHATLLEKDIRAIIQYIMNMQIPL